MDWKKFYRDSVKKSNEDDFLRHVHKTVNGVAISKVQFMAIINSIKRSLLLTTEDVVLDLCCGNGIVTKNISKYCHNMLAVDLSPDLIRIANRYNCSDNIKYVNDNLLTLKKVPRDLCDKINKAYLYECLQCFSHTDYERILSIINRLFPNLERIFIGSIPDKELIWSFYDTPEKKEAHLKRVREGTELFGTWWDKNFLYALSKSKGFNVEFVVQNTILHTSRYRFDMILER